MNSPLVGKWKGGRCQLQASLALIDIRIPFYFDFILFKRETHILRDKKTEAGLF